MKRRISLLAALLLADRLRRKQTIRSPEGISSPSQSVEKLPVGPSASEVSAESPEPSGSNYIPITYFTWTGSTVFSPRADLHLCPDRDLPLPEHGRVSGR